MMRFIPVPEPVGFEEKVRQPGRVWLTDHPDARRARDYWTPFKPVLAEGFGHLCGYSVMHEPVGSVDHYISWHADRSLTYEWSNYRFASAWINSSKQTADERVLDPYEVGDDWFEILLPSLQLVITDRVPVEYRARAEYTLQRLHLRNDERVVRQRQEWYRMYRENEITLDGLRKKAPLIARAIAKQQENSF
jgi:hypothetical protein